MNDQTPVAREGPAKPVRPKPRGKVPKLAETLEGYPEQSTHEIKPDANPFSASDWRLLSYAWTGFAVRVLLIVAGVFSAVQYLQSREEARISRTLQLVDIWDRAEYQEAQRAVKDRLAGLNQQYAGLLGAGASPAERRIFMESIGVAALTEEGGAMPLEEFREHFERVVYFLNRLSSCANTNLCSRDVTDEFFRAYAESFWAYFSGYAQRQRRAGSPNYAVSLETYAARAR